MGVVPRSCVPDERHPVRRGEPLPLLLLVALAMPKTLDERNQENRDGELVVFVGGSLSCAPAGMEMLEDVLVRRRDGGGII